jgi:hypothetical protein
MLAVSSTEIPLIHPEPFVDTFRWYEDCRGSNKHRSYQIDKQERRGDREREGR